MKIHDSLRHECMPEMVYSICKLANSKKYRKEDLKRLITLDCENTQNYNKVYKFSIECGFIEELDDSTVTTAFDDKALTSFKSFRYAIFMNVYHAESTMFNNLSKWYLTQGSEIFGYKSAQDLAIVIPSDIAASAEKDFVLGFRFWMVALGMAMLQKAGSGATMVFACNQIISEWLSNEKPFKKGQTILMKDFVSTLISQCPVFEECAKENHLNLALSMALRVLHTNNQIQLKYTTDSGDTWHLVESMIDFQTNDITEVIVR